MLLIMALCAFADDPPYPYWYDHVTKRVNCPNVDWSKVWNGQRVTGKDAKWTVTILASGKKSPTFDCVRSVGYEKEQYWIALLGDKETLLVDAMPGPFFDAIDLELARMPVMVGGRVAYVALDAGKMRVVHGTSVGPAYDWAGKLPLPWDSNPTGEFQYEAYCGQTHLIVTSGQEPPCPAP